MSCASRVEADYEHAFQEVDKLLKECGPDGLSEEPRDAWAHGYVAGMRDMRFPPESTAAQQLEELRQANSRLYRALEQIAGPESRNPTARWMHAVALDALEPGKWPSPPPEPPRTRRWILGAVLLLATAALLVFLAK